MELRRSKGDLLTFVRSRASVEPFAHRHVKVKFSVTRESAEIVVEDEGKGFNVQEVTSVGLNRSIGGDGGQGLILMWAFMDHVRFNRTGNRVTLIKNREEHAPPPELDDAAEAEIAAAEAEAALSEQSDYGELVQVNGGRSFSLPPADVSPWDGTKAATLWFTIPPFPTIIVVCIAIRAGGSSAIWRARTGCELITNTCMNTCYVQVPC